MAKKSVDAVKGFSDFTGEVALKRLRVRRIIEDTFLEFGFEPAETPIIEDESFVTGGNRNDEAVRDVYRLQDRGGRELALRFEFTFQLKRISQKQKLPYKRFQIGYNFRDEPIREGRLRQFIQCDCDVVGSTVNDEAELLSLLSTVFCRLDMPVRILFNNRKLVNEVLVACDVAEKNREQVIREIDKIGKISKKELVGRLEELGAAKVLQIFEGGENELKKYSFFSEVVAFRNRCKEFGVNAEFSPTLMRGLSYYTGTVVEVFSESLNVSLAGGGAYKIEEMDSFGVSLGLEPIILVCPLNGEAAEVLVISLEQEIAAISLAQKLRDEGKRVQLMLDKTLKRAMEYADSKRISSVIVVGEQEVASGIYEIKNMKSGAVSSLTI